MTTINMSWKKWLLLIVVFIIGASLYVYSYIQGQKAQQNAQFETFIKNQMLWELQSRRCAVLSNAEYYESQIRAVYYVNNSLTWWVRCYNSRNASNYIDMQLRTNTADNMARMQKIYQQLNMTALPEI